MSPPGRLVTDAPLAHLRWEATPCAHPVAGPVLLLLHGIGGGRQAWGGGDGDDDDHGHGHGDAGTGPAFAAAGFTVLAVDLPGYGQSAPVAPCTLAAIARAVQRLIDGLGMGPAVVLGHSMGGMVAQTLIATAPQAVAALVLAGTSPAFGKPGGDWQQGFLQSRCAPLDAGLGMVGLAAQLVPTMVAPGTAAAVIEKAQALMAGVPEATYRAALSALVVFDGRADLPRIGVPTLVITGQHDTTAPPEVARRMAERIPGARLHTVPGAGHLLPIEQPRAFTTAVLDFLQPR